MTIHEKIWRLPSDVTKQKMFFFLLLKVLSKQD